MDSYFSLNSISSGSKAIANGYNCVKNLPHTTFTLVKDSSHALWNQKETIAKIIKGITLSAATCAATDICISQIPYFGRSYIKPVILCPVVLISSIYFNKNTILSFAKSQSLDYLLSFDIDKTNILIMRITVSQFNKNTIGQYIKNNDMAVANYLDRLHAYINSNEKDKDARALMQTLISLIPDQKEIRHG